MGRALLSDFTFGQFRPVLLVSVSFISWPSRDLTRDPNLLPALSLGVDFYKLKDKALSLFLAAFPGRPARWTAFLYPPVVGILCPFSFT